MNLVVGATGSLGGRITRSLLGQGKAVRFPARNNPISAELARQGRANSAQSLIEAGAQPVNADLKDPASLAAACKGCHTVITTATATQRGGDDTLESIDLQGTQDLIEAAKNAGVRHFVYISVPGAAPDHPLPLFRYKGSNEAILEKSGMTYTILQPSVFMEIWIGMVVGIPLMTRQTIRLMGKGDHYHNFVSEADVAAFAVAALDNPKADNQRVLIGGPSSYTWTEIVAAVGKGMGAPLPVEYVPLGTQVPYLPSEAQTLFAGMETFETYADMRELAPAYGVTLTTLEEFIQRTFVKQPEAAAS